MTTISDFSAETGEPEPARAGPSWYLRRLAAMSPGEVAARFARAPLHRIDDLEWRLARGRWSRRWQPTALRTELVHRPLGFLTVERAGSLAAHDPGGAAALVARADGILRGEIFASGYPAASLPLGQRDYARDPKSGYRWPSVHGKRLDFRGAPADPRWSWELNRCQEFPLLVGASLVTGDSRYEEAAADGVLEWVDQQAPGRGIAWANGFEAGIRAISLALTFDALCARGDLRDRLRDPLLTTLWQHARWIERDPSTHSSANNHRLGELAGLLAVAVLVPELSEAARWKSHALTGLRKEATRQILPDGTGAEQSFAYTLFVLDLLLVSVALLDATGETPPVELLEALERAGRAFWAQFGRPDEPEPRYGDDDEGRAFRLDALERRSGRGLAAAICARVSSSYARTAANRLDLTAWWLFGEPGRARFAGTRPAELPSAVLLESSRLAILRRGATRVTVDAGPLGYLSIAAHGHADALSVTVSTGGDELVTDPGSGTYLARARKIRRAFRGTGFHATALVDGQDQSTAGGPFLWSRHAQSRLLAVDLGTSLVLAEHDGYSPHGVRHRRAVLLPTPLVVLVCDRLEADGEHAVSIRWPLDAGLSAGIAAEDEVRAVSDQGTGLLIKTSATGPGALSVAHGARTPFEGWTSDRLDHFLPAPLVKWDAHFEGRLFVVTALAPVSDGWPDLRVTHALSGETLQVEVASGSQSSSVAVDFARDEGPPGGSGRA